MNIHQIAEVMEALYMDYGYHMLISKNDERLNTELLDHILGILTDEEEDYYGVCFTELLDDICQSNNVEVRACACKGIVDDYEVCSFILKDKINGETVFRLNVPWCC